jgi:hypothetical protein
VSFDYSIVQNTRFNAVETDKAILAVIDRLYEYEEKLRSLVDSRGNIFTIFFHDLAIHFSGILIQREALTTESGPVSFPYVGQEYARSPRRLGLDSNEGTKTKSQIKSFLRGMRIRPFAVGNAIPLGYKQDYFLSKMINLLGECQEQARVFVDRSHIQDQILGECIEHLCIEQSIPNSDAVNRNWFDYVALHCSSKLMPVTTNTLMIGNRQDLQNRKLAHNFLEQDKEVVAFTHGEIASTIFDEPMYHYAERGLCTTLIEYGRSTAKEKSSEFVLMGPQKTLYRDSKVAREAYQSSDDIVSQQLTGRKILYIPTTYVGNEIYGPFHAYPDSVYAEWHSAINRAIPSVIFKVHPKTKSTRLLPGRHENRWLDDCIEEYDVLLLDYMATSMARAMLTNKPVIFFDIGLRRVTPEFLTVLKERCYYVPIDINGDLNDQIHGAINTFSNKDHCWSNLNIAKYCLSGKETFRWKDIFWR